MGGILRSCYHLLSDLPVSPPTTWIRLRPLWRGLWLPEWQRNCCVVSRTCWKSALQNFLEITFWAAQESCSWVGFSLEVLSYKTAPGAQGSCGCLVLALQRLDVAGDWNSPGRVEKPSSVTTRLKGEKGEAEQQGTSSAWGVGVDGRAKKKCRIER